MEKNVIVVDNVAKLATKKTKRVQKSRLPISTVIYISDDFAIIFSHLIPMSFSTAVSTNF